MEALAPPLVAFRAAALPEIPTLEPAQKEALVVAMRDWNYGEGGVFQRDVELGGHSLFWTTSLGIHHFGLCEKLSIDPSKLHQWIFAIERCMKPSSEVPYHNAVHVCDVVHAVWWYLEEGRLADLLTPRAILAVLMAACAHDTGHPGLNNSWWADRELGRTYHGRSPLENFHIRQGLELMRGGESDVLGGCSADDRQTITAYIIDAILDTDLAYHAKECARFKLKLDAGSSFARESEEDQALLVNMCLKAADIANPAKSWRVYSPWIDCLFKEFYAQGDKELASDVQPAPFMNRNDDTTCPPKAQIGFITYLMRPLMTEWARLVPRCEAFLGTLDVNLGLLAKWQVEIEAARASDTPPA